MNSAWAHDPIARTWTFDRFDIERSERGLSGAVVQWVIYERREGQHPRRLTSFSTLRAAKLHAETLTVDY